MIIEFALCGSVVDSCVLVFIASSRVVLPLQLRTVPACAITFVTYEYVFAAVMGHTHRHGVPPSPSQPPVGPNVPVIKVLDVPIEDSDGVGGDFGSTS